MRTIVAVAASLGILLLGLVGISQQAQQVKPGLSSQSANQSYNVSVGVFEGVGHAGAEALPWFGVAAVVLAACGLLVVAASGGGR